MQQWAITNLTTKLTLKGLLNKSTSLRILNNPDCQRWHTKDLSSKTSLSMASWMTKYTRACKMKSIVGEKATKAKRILRNTISQSSKLLRPSLRVPFDSSLQIHYLQTSSFWTSTSTTNSTIPSHPFPKATSKKNKKGKLKKWQVEQDEEQWENVLIAYYYKYFDLTGACPMKKSCDPFCKTYQKQGADWTGLRNLSDKAKN